MLSWQGRWLELVLKVQRLFERPGGELDVARERADLEKWGRRARSSLHLETSRADARGVPVEWVVAPGVIARRVLLYLHGGSYIAGSIDTHRTLAANVGHVARARTLVVGYRLAPEHPFPAAVEDVVSVCRWALASGVDPTQTIVAGDSAGGGLALAALVALRDAGDPLPAAAVCLSPWTDLAATGRSWVARAGDDLVLTPAELRSAARTYLGETDPCSPLASPLYADLRGLPSTLIQVGTREILFSDSAQLAERARAVGVDVVLDVWDGMMHGWQFVADFLPEGRRAVDAIGRFIDRRMPAP